MTSLCHTNKGKLLYRREVCRTKSYRKLYISNISNRFKVGNSDRKFIMIV